MKPRRVNFALLGWMFVALAAMTLLKREVWLAAAMAALAVVYFVLHRIRVRRFAEYDRMQNFD